MNKDTRRKDMTKGDIVAKELENDILSGVLSEGSPVPSLGDTAKRFSVSLRTVREAYKVLEAKGLIETSQGKCATVKSVTLPGVWDLIKDKSRQGGRRFEKERFASVMDIERLSLERAMMKYEIDDRLTGNELFPIDIPYLLAWHGALLSSTGNAITDLLAHEAEKDHIKSLEKAYQKAGQKAMDISRDMVDAVGGRNQILASALFTELTQELLSKAF